MKKQTTYFAKQSLFCALILWCAASAVFAVTVSEYRAKIHRAKLSVDSLLYGDDDESPSAQKTSVAERETLKQLRLLLPPSEKVEAKNISVETQNKWFAEKLGEYEKEVDPAKRRTILTAVSERLGALEQEIAQLEQTSNAARSKDEDKRQLNEILSREEFRKPEPPEENFLQRLWRKINVWLDDNFPSTNPFSIPEEGLSALSFFLQILIYALVLGGIAFVLYKFAPFFRAKFGFGKKERRSDRVVLGETLTADADSYTIFEEAENLARAGQLRQAIRKGYIALLCDLSDRKIIGLAKNKTNRDYLRDVRARAEIFDDVKILTNDFEQHWYGVGAPAQADWNSFREKYKAVGSKF